jgi:hypothetical protein
MIFGDIAVAAVLLRKGLGYRRCIQPAALVTVAGTLNQNGTLAAHIGSRLRIDRRVPG